MKLLENISRIREVMGIITEQKSNVFTDKVEYEKALKLYNKAKKLSDESLRKFNLFKNQNFTFFSEYVMTSDQSWSDRFNSQVEEFMKSNNLPDWKYFEKYENIIKPVTRWVIDYFYSYPSPTKPTDYIKKIRTYPYDVKYSVPPNYDASKLTWEFSRVSLIYTPRMPKPVLEVKQETKPKSEVPKPQEPLPPKKPENQIIKSRELRIPVPGEKIEGPNGTLIGYVDTDGKTFIPFTKSDWINWNGQGPSSTRNQDLNLLNHEGALKSYIRLKFGGYIVYGSENLYEDMKVDDWGRLHDEDIKITYPYKKIARFLNWFEKEWGNYAEEQGWFIVTSDTDLPKVKYKPEEGNKYNLFFQVQRIDDPMEGEALTGKLKNDLEAEELAKKIGLVLDEYGVVIGWQNDIFI